MKINKKNPIIIFLAAAGLLLFLHGVGILRPLENSLIFITQPLAGRLYDWGVARRASDQIKQNQAQLTAQVTSLSKEVEILTVADAQNKELADENQKLRSTLQFLNTNNFTAVTAGVIAQDGLSADSRALIINRGARDGIKVGLGVVDDSGALVGQIVEVKDTTARVCLTTNAGCQLAASFQNTTKTAGLTDGDLGLTIKMDYIPSTENIAVGDTVVTSGLGGDIPRGLLIGHVTQVINTSNDVWQTATIEPLVNLNDLTVVSVIMP